MRYLLDERLCPGLVQLMDTVYSKVDLLREAGLLSFQPGLRFVQDHCESEAEFEEYEALTIARNKRHIFANPRSPQSLIEPAAKDQSQSAINAYKRRLVELHKSNPNVFNASLRSYEHEMLTLWGGEVERFGMSVIVGGAPSLAKVSSFTKTIMDSCLNSNGFWVDHTAKDRQHITYSKKLTQSYKICWKVDSVLLRKPVETPLTMTVRDTGEVKQLPAPGPSLDIWLGLYQTSTGGTLNRILGLPFEWLFPIREGPFGGRCYHPFYNTTELAALIVIYTTMYNLISAQFERSMHEIVELCR